MDDLQPSDVGGGGSESSDRTFSRRGLLLGAGVASVAGVGGYVANSALGTPTVQAGSAVELELIPALGANQAGVNRPVVPQQHCLITVIDFDVAAARESLAALGEAIVAATTGPHGDPELTPDGIGDLSVTVGLGPDALARSRHPELAGLIALPTFAGDADLAADARAGHLLLSVNASNPMVLEPVLGSLLSRLPGVSVRWSEFGYRGPAVDGVARNPFGYFDGIIGPTTAREFDTNVWISDGPLAGGTICVVRRFRLDIDRFRLLSATERDRVFGRKRSTAAPLSGGSRNDEINPDAKTAEGTLLIPQSAHASAAHPSFTGSGMMVRRSYSYRASDTDHGHVFVSFQNDVRTFSRTQLRLDELDALSAFTTPTATGAFAVLPGIRPGSPLGSTLF